MWSPSTSLDIERYKSGSYTTVKKKKFYIWSCAQNLWEAVGPVPEKPVAFTAIKREKFSVANQSLSKLSFLLFFFKVKFITNALLIYKTLLLKLVLLSRYSVETRALSVFKEQKHIVWIKLWLHL